MTIYIEDLSPEELMWEIIALEADYQDWVDRHDGNYEGDYWD